MNRTLSLILFLVLVLGGGLVLGFRTAPGEWYARAYQTFLQSARLAVRAGLDGTLYLHHIFIAIAGWRIWQRDRTGLPMKFWWAQLVLNFLWTPVSSPPTSSAWRSSSSC